MTTNQKTTVYVAARDGLGVQLPRGEAKPGDRFAFGTQSTIAASGYRLTVDESYLEQTRDRFGVSPFEDMSEAAQTARWGEIRWLAEDNPNVAELDALNARRAQAERARLDQEYVLAAAQRRGGLGNLRALMAREARRQAQGDAQ